MLHDPMRSQFRAWIVGLILGIVALGGCAIVGLLRPQGAVGNANIVVGKDSGALYVVMGDRLHPVLNLASARLIAGSNEKPTSVKDAKLGSYSRGPLLGIPGAPQALPGSASGNSSNWIVCETVALSPSGSARSSQGVTTTVIASAPELGPKSRALAGDQAFLVARAGKTYLLFDGFRAEIDLNNSTIARSLALAGITPRPVGTGLLGATVEVPPLRPPDIPDAGQPSRFGLGGAKIGSVVKVSGIADADLYVVLADGVQRISPFAAEVIRNANSQGASDIASVPPDALDGVPIVDRLPVDHFPNDVPKIRTAEDDPVGCLAWSRGTDDRAAQVRLLGGTGLPLSPSQQPVSLATSDGSGDRVDATYIPPSTGEFVQTTGVEADSVRRDSLFFVADTGIRYGVLDLPTATALGIGEKPKLAPWPIVGLLVPGPTLSQANALVSHDSVAPDPKAATVQLPKK